MEKTVVLYPGLAVSHFVPMIQLADALLEAGYAVTVVLIDPTLKPDIAFAAAVDHAAATKPAVTFHKLPVIRDPPAITYDAHFLLGYFQLVSRYNQHLHEFLCSMRDAGSVHALVMDMLSVEALDVARKLGIPAYTFFPSNASALATSIQVSSTRAGEGETNFGEMGDAHLDLHGVPPVPASHIFAELLESPETEIHKSVTNMLRGIQEADGILVNSFESLEPRAVAALRDLRCCLAPVYCVGPLVAASAGVAARDKREDAEECIAWLDAQPERSVVFLCFGSLYAGNHSAEQLKEIAVGLDKSGHRFLWVVRAPPPPRDDTEKLFDPRAERDLDALMPEGFLERTNGRGLVVKSWVPQVDVLRHRATGAFVTHCGWNSVLEGITAGVPMLCWPLYAEQKMNKVFMVEEYGVAVEVDGWQQGLVKAEEVEAKVRMVMESEKGEQLRTRVTEHREAAAMAWKDGGSSRAAFSRFLSDAGNVRLGPARP